jgi:hypothetical protein
MIGRGNDQLACDRYAPQSLGATLPDKLRSLKRSAHCLRASQTHHLYVKAPNKFSEVTPAKNQRKDHRCYQDVEQFSRTIATIWRNAEPPFNEIHSDRLLA